MPRRTQAPARRGLTERIKENPVTASITVLTAVAVMVGAWFAVGDDVLNFLDRDRIAAERNMDRLEKAIDRAEADVASSEEKGANVSHERETVQRAKEDQQRAEAAYAAGDYEAAQRFVQLAHEDLEQIDRTKTPGPGAVLAAVALALAAGLVRRRARRRETP